MQKGYKREAKGKAVLLCFIGLFTVIIVVLGAAFMLQLDYSDKLPADAPVRPYVETTPTPTPDPQMAALLATPVPSQVPTPVPTQIPTPTPVPTPTPSPTPEPTSFPEEVWAPVRSDGFTMPALSTLDAELGITYSYRSVADGYRRLQLKGYAYVNDATYDGAQAQLFLVITQDGSSRDYLAIPTKVAGISGVNHADAKCANASASDFEIVLDVTQFKDEIYSLGMVFMYTDSEGTNHLEYFRFPGDTNFTILGSQAISDIALTAE